MNRTLLTALAAAFAVGIVGWLLRRISTPDEDTVRMPGPHDPLPGDEVATVEDHGARFDEDDEVPEEIVALTSDGWAFVPDGAEVQIVPPTGTDEDMPDAYGGPAPSGRSSETPRRRPVGQFKPGEHLDAGDLAGVRVVRGSPAADPWRLEAIGRDGEYRAWAFETQEAARAALDLLERRIVITPLGVDGEPHAPDEEDYAVGYARTQKGIADLAMDSDYEPGSESDRR